MDASKVQVAALRCRSSNFANFRKRLDEWKLEQGMVPADIRIDDNTNSEETLIARKEAEDEEKDFAEEISGWHGYIEWEAYPTKRAKAAEILARHEFPQPPEFQLSPVPDTNPVLEGVRWKMWHKALGGPLTSIPEESWLRVIQEKHPDMLHLLQFPYNGEPPKVT